MSAKHGARSESQREAFSSLATGACAQCGKWSYPTREVAKRAARQFTGIRKRAYRCGDSWHLTSHVSMKETMNYRERP